MRLRHLALPAAAGLSLLAIPLAPAAQAAPAAAACDPAANTCTALFAFTGSTQSFTVPAGVTNLLVAIGGARGGDGLEVDGTPQGGVGGGYEAIVPVQPGQVLTLVVGGKGGDAVPVELPAGKATAAAVEVPPAAPGGYGGGGAGTSALDGPVGGGGGGSFLFSGDTLLLAAGGGGGAGYTGGDEGATVANGGAGGASAAGHAAAGDLGGGGAAAKAGGAAGGGDDGTAGSGPASGPAAFGNGGAAAGTCSAGGGGGGYFGGGSGGCTEVPNDDNPPAKTAAKADGAKPKAHAAAAADDADFTITAAGGGGGGAGFLGAGVSQVASLGDVANRNDDGVIAIGYTSAATTTTLTTSVSTLAPGQEATLDATVAGPDLEIADASNPATAAGKAAVAAFGQAAAAALVATPNQPAAPGTTVNPATACQGLPVPLPSGVTPTPCTVTFFVNGKQLGDPIPVDAASKVASVIFTAGSDQGLRTITARYDGNLYYLQSTSAPVTINVAGLANTGPSNVAPMLGASAALLVVGAGLVAYGRRRPQTGSHRAA